MIEGSGKDDSPQKKKRARFLITQAQLNDMSLEEREKYNWKLRPDGPLEIPSHAWVCRPTPD